jgi:hypothetical protein
VLRALGGGGRRIETGIGNQFALIRVAAVEGAMMHQAQTDPGAGVQPPNGFLAGRGRPEVRGRAGRRLAAPRSRASDRHKPRSAPKIELVLYVSAASEKSARAVRAIREILSAYDEAQVRFTICDMSGRPEDGDADAVVFTPTLVKRAPGPRTWIVGNMEQPDLLTELLDTSGVDRKVDRR